MPPRHAYWTILVDDQPTAFRAASADELMATFNRLRERHPSAVMKWFERGRLWNSRDEASQASRQASRGDSRPRPPSGGADRPRDRAWRPGGDHRDPRQKYKDAKKAKWQRFKQKVRGQWDRRREAGPAQEPGSRRQDGFTRRPARPGGDAGRPLGKPPRSHGDRARPHGDPMRPHGDQARPHGKPVRPHGDRARPHGKPLRPHGDRARPHGDPMRPAGKDTRRPAFGGKTAGERKPWSGRPAGARHDRPPRPGGPRKPWVRQPDHRRPPPPRKRRDEDE